jgi:hypothetical protein
VFHYQPCSPFDLAVAQFCAGVETGEQRGQSRLTGYEVDELIAHIRRSAEEHQAVEIDWRI